MEVEPMYFNFVLNLNMTLSSADNLFKQFGRRSGPKFCKDLIGIILFDKLRLSGCILNWL